jgi:cysteine synthase
MSELTHLPAHERMTPKECLQMSARQAEEYADVIVIGYNTDGELTVQSSAMSRKDALWLLMAAIDHARGLK